MTGLAEMGVARAATTTAMLALVLSGCWSSHDEEPFADGDADTDTDADADADADSDADADGDADVDPCPESLCCAGKACPSGFLCDTGNSCISDPCVGEECCEERRCAEGFDCVAGGCARRSTVGEACDSRSDCEGPDAECLRNAEGWPGGYCIESCTGGGQCSGDGVCVGAACFDGCLVRGDCRIGYECMDVPGGSACSPE